MRSYKYPVTDVAGMVCAKTAPAPMRANASEITSRFNGFSFALDGGSSGCYEVRMSVRNEIGPEPSSNVFKRSMKARLILEPRLG